MDRDRAQSHLDVFVVASLSSQIYLGSGEQGIVKGEGNTVNNELWILSVICCLEFLRTLFFQLQDRINQALLLNK